MKIIDAHVHFSKIASFAECAAHSSLTDYTKAGFLSETAENQVVHCVCMGLTESAPFSFPDADAPTPMLADLEDELPAGMSLCLGVNPHRLNEHSLADMEELISCGRPIAGGSNNAGVENTNGGRPIADGRHNAACIKIAGIKIYAGYYHFDVSNPVYDPVYELAEKYDLAVAVHTGDTFSNKSLLKYAHPLCLDELAIAHPALRIVACHIGAPWVFDACEAAGKNENVYIDISGLLVGNEAYINRHESNPLILDRYRQALCFLDNYDKVLFGTDWPLAPMNAYIDFCKKLVPPESYEKVFYRNALDVYHLNF